MQSQEAKVLVCHGGNFYKIHDEFIHKTKTNLTQTKYHSNMIQNATVTHLVCLI